MMRRLHESNVVAQRRQLCGICEEMQRAARSVPPWSARRGHRIENREAAAPDAEQWTVLKFALIDAVEPSADLTDSTEDDPVTLVCRVSHPLSLSSRTQTLGMSPPRPPNPGGLGLTIAGDEGFDVCQWRTPAVGAIDVQAWHWQLHSIDADVLVA